MILFLDGLAGFFMLGMGILGFWRGFVEELGRLLGLIIAILVALRYYVEVAGELQPWFDIDIWILLFFSYAVVFSIMLLGVRFLTRLVHFLLVSRGTKWTNQSMGFLFGVLKGALVVALVIWIIDLSPMDEWSEILYKESTMAQSLFDGRVRIIQIFGWEDSAAKGELFIKEIMRNEKPNKNSEYQERNPE